MRVYYPGGNTPAHLAVSHHQGEILQYIKKQQPELFTLKNFSGETPLQLAQRLSEKDAQNITDLTTKGCGLDLEQQPLSKADTDLQSSHEKQLKALQQAKERSVAIVDFLSNAADTPPADQHTGNPLLFPLEPVNQQIVAEADSLLKKGIKKSDFEKLRTYLPEIWSSAQTACQLALDTLKTSPEQIPSKQSHIKQALSALFGERYDPKVLEEKLVGILCLLKNIKDSDEIIETVILHENHSCDGLLGWVDERSNTTSINLIPTRPDFDSFYLLSHAVIHEISHMTNGSLDFAYRNIGPDVVNEEPKKVGFHGSFNPLIALTDVNQPRDFPYTRDNLRGIEIALIHNVVKGQYKPEELQEITESINRIIRSTRQSNSLASEINSLLTVNVKRISSLMDYYANLNTTCERDLGENERTIAQENQFIENRLEMIRKQGTAVEHQKKAIGALRRLSPPEVSMLNADTIAYSVNFLTGISCCPQEYIEAHPEPSALSDIVALGLSEFTGLNKTNAHQWIYSEKPDDLLRENATAEMLTASMAATNETEVVSVPLQPSQVDNPFSPLLTCKRE